MLSFMTYSLRKIICGSVSAIALVSIIFIAPQIGVQPSFAADKNKAYFGDEYNPQNTEMKSISCGENMKAYLSL